MKEPVRALRLLDEAEAGKSMPLNIIDDLRSAVYRNLYQCKSAFYYARKSYLQDSLADDNPSHLLEMTTVLAELSYLLSENKESLRYAIQGVELARELHDKPSECKMLFCIGENKRMLSFKEEGYDFFDQAIRALNASGNANEKVMLSYFYGVKMTYLIDDGKLEDALAIGLQREELLDGMKGEPEVRESLLDQQYAYVYSKLATLFQMTGNAGRAADYYKKYQSTHASATPDGKYDATPYLLVTKQYKEALDYCRDFKEVMRRQDTLNIQYIGILQKEISIYRKLKDYEKIAALQSSVIAITDSIYEREKKNAALELDTLYEVNEKEARISELAFKLTIRTVTLLFVLCFSLLALCFIWRLWVQNRKIRNKNKVLAARVNDELSIQEEKDRTSAANVPADLSFQEKTEETSGNEEQESLMNKLIFSKLDYIIKRDKLYLSADLSREELARMVKMNNTRFAKMIKENTGTNLNGYINNLRLNHAIHLLQEQPDYTLRAIAEASGINSMPTFHQLFKAKTGMTPLEFKNAQKDLKK